MPTWQPTYQQGEAARSGGFAGHGRIRGGAQFPGSERPISRGGEAGTDQFGAQFLLRDDPGETGEVFQLQAVLDALLGLFNSAAGMIKSAKSAAG